MNRLYVAGPYRSHSVRGIVENIRRAEEVGIRAMELGWFPLIPHCNSALWDGLFPDSVFLASGIAWLEVCNAVVLVPGWIDSEGTIAEIKRARALNLPAYESDQLPDLRPPKVPCVCRWGGVRYAGDHAFEYAKPRTHWCLICHHERGCHATPEAGP